MAQLQAQIVTHGEASSTGLLIEDVGEVYGSLAELGVWPLGALLEARRYADEQSINEALGKPTVEPADWDMSYRPDPTRPEIWVDPQEFLELGVACVFHRHILVTPVIDVSDMPPLTLVSSSGD